MQIIFLYVERFNHIENQQFHFNKSYSIFFDNTKKEITIEKSRLTTFPYFHQNFLNITAIIGKNGSGKSSLLAMIESFYGSYHHLNRYLAVLQDINGKIFVLDNAFRNTDLTVNSSTILDIVYIKDDNEFISRQISLVKVSNSFSIYEGGIQKGRFQDLSFDNIIDVRSVESNKYLLNNYDNLLSTRENHTDTEFREFRSRMMEWTLLRNFLFEHEILKNVDFISRFQAEEWSFVPRSIDIALSDSFFYNNKDLFTGAGIADQLDNLQKILFEEGKTKFDNTFKYELFKKKIIVYLYLFIVARSYYFSQMNEELLEFNKSFNKLGTADNAFDLIYRFLNDHSEWSRYPFSGIKDLITNIDKFFDVNVEREFDGHDNYFYSFAINENVRNSLHSIFDIWRDQNFIFYIKWHGLSAGEAALLNIFSKINSARDQYTNTIWLIIDEGDLYLHPEWQRTFLSNLHQYLPLIFRDKKIQLILTSHSPFIVSDLPESNVILLDKEFGWAKVIDSSKLGKTFGANIHSLLINAFFLRNGQIGEFSKSLINQLFNHLNNSLEENEKWNYQNCLSLINDIGDQFVKHQLTILLAAKYKNNVESDWIDKEIDRLEKQKRDLK